MASWEFGPESDINYSLQLEAEDLDPLKLQNDILNLTRLISNSDIKPEGTTRIALRLMQRTATNFFHQMSPIR